MNTRTWLRFGAAAIALLAAWITGYSQSRRGYLPAPAFDFGSVRQGHVVEHRFTIQNPGQSPATLSIAGLSHPGMKVRMPQAVASGASGTITVTWDTRFVQGYTTVQVLLRFNETESVVLSMSADVIPPIDIRPYPAVFLSGYPSDRVTRTLEIVNNDTEPLNIRSISSETKVEPAPYSATVSTLEPGRRHQLDIELSSSARVGRSEHVLVVLTDSAKFPVIRIPVKVLAKEDVYVNPESVDFGQTNGAHTQETFLLKARLAAIQILSVSCDLPFVKVTHTSSGAATTHQFQAEIDSADLQEGPFSGTILIKTDDPSFPELNVPVQGEVLRFR